MTTFPEEIHRGADGYSMMRLSTYDLSVEQWVEMFHASRGKLAWSAGPDDEGITTELRRELRGDVFFRTGDSAVIKSYGNFLSIYDALAYHNELAADIVERIELMEQHEVSALSEGAL